MVNHQDLKRSALAAKGDTPREQATNRARGKHRLFYEGEARRKAVLEAVAGGALVKDAVAGVGVTYSTYEKWRTRFRDWAARVDTERNRHTVSAETNFDTLNRAFDIAQERQRWWGHDTPPFQMEMLTALRETPPGGIVMVLLPPEHGKTTCYEDFKSVDLGHNPWLLNHVASETQILARKVLAKLRNRFDPSALNGPALEFVNRYGPFAPQAGERKTVQPWSATFFDIYRKGEWDDRDYTMAALGFGSQIIGSRSHHLHCDDLQSMKSLNQTDKMLDEFQQDWLSRPGEHGFTSIFGNRVDEGDIYQAIEETFDPDLLRIVRYPAILEDADGTVRPLWPERWPLEKLDRMKRKLRSRNGSDARWERNWMQRPQSKLFLTFTQGMIDQTKNPYHSLVKPQASDGRLAYLTLDPALDGRTAIMVIQRTHAGRIRPVYIRDLPALRSNEAIMQECGSAIRWAELAGFTVTDWIIEAKNFQAGLSRDERLRELSRHHGINVREHLTGMNKYDENAGVPSMVTTFVKGEIELPWAPDDETRSLIGQLEHQLLRWRPYVKGNKLRQDLVMALWFGWIVWRATGKPRTDERADASSFRFTALPYAQAPSGLILPEGYNPTILGGVK